MTVPTGNASAALSWTGVETNWSPGFVAAEATDVALVYTPNSGSPVNLAQGVHYNAALDGQGNYSATPIASAMPPPPGTVAFARHSSFLQAIVFQNGVPAPAASLQDVADWSVMRDQEIERDVGASSLYSSAAAASAAAAAASAIVAASEASVAAAIAATNWGVWPTRAAFAAATIGAAITAVHLLGYSNPGDAGEAVYSRLGSAPGVVLAGHVQTADGAWWTLSRQPVYPVAQFGAFPSSPDCTAAINAAVAWLQASGGGELVFIGGVYTILGTIGAYGTQRVSYRGAGSYSTRLTFGPGTADCIIWGGTALNAQASGGFIRDLTIDCSSRTGGRAIYAQYTFWGPVIDTVVIVNCFNGIQWFSCNTPSVNNFLVQGCDGQWAMYWSDTSLAQDSPAINMNNIVVNCGYSGADGLWMDGQVDTANMLNVTFLACRIGMWVKNTAETVGAVQFIVAFNVITDGMMQNGLKIDGGREFYFTDCWFQNTSTPGATGAGKQGFNDTEAISISGDAGASITSDIHFTNCRIGNSKQNGVTIFGGARNIKFNGCLIEPGGKGGANQYDGISICTDGSAGQDISVVDCDFFSWGDPLNWRYGVNVGPGTFRIMIEGGDYFGVGTNPVLWGNSDSQSLCRPGLGNSGGMSPGPVTLGSATVGGSFTATAAQLLGEAFVLGGSPGAFTVTGPTAAQMVAALKFPASNKIVDLLLVNGTNGACTFATGAGCDAFGATSATNQYSVAAGTSRLIKIMFKITAPGAEYVTFIG